MTDDRSPYVPAAQPPIVAVVLNPDGTKHDACYSWETGQTYALHQGMAVVAVADDGAMTVDQAQRLYDADRAAFRDCYGIA